MSESTGGTSICLLKRLPRELWVEASRTAAEINPVNHPPLERLARIDPGFDPTPERIAVVTTQYWAAAGVRLTVGFLDNPTSNLRARILSDMNAWAQTANVSFGETATDPQVRIARTPRDGYWSYLARLIHYRRISAFFPQFIENSLNIHHRMFLCSYVCICGPNGRRKSRQG